MLSFQKYEMGYQRKERGLAEKDSDYLYKNCAVCEHHFAESMFMNASAPKKRLIWSAIPTLV